MARRELAEFTRHVPANVIHFLRRNIDQGARRVKLDRRRLLGSLAATPALGPHAAQSAGQDPPGTIEEDLERGSIWHVQPGERFNHIRHLATGLTLHQFIATKAIITSSHYFDPWPFDDDCFEPVYRTTQDALHRALSYLRSRPLRKGAVFFQYSFEKPDYRHANPIVNDAPPM
jgi:hypothetical protein